MSRVVPIVLGCLLIAICTYVQGSWTQRWSSEQAEQLSLLASRYADIPMTLQNWEGEDLTQNAKVLERAGAAATISRRYVNQETGESVTVFMICGYSRDVAVHTPDACYVGSGFEMERRPVKRYIKYGQNTGEMFTSTFLKERGEAAIHQRVLWAWTRGGRWEAPESPRWKYGGRSILNKVYLISNIPEEVREEPEVSTAFVFGQAFLSEAAKALYPPTANAVDGKVAGS